MASRGKTVAGTDGTDHTFREKVASQYRESAKLKRNLRTMFMLLTIPLAMLAIHVSKINDNIKLTNQVLPKPEPWEYVYLVSGIFNLIGYSSLSRNNTQRLTIYFYGTAMAAFGGIVWGAVAHAREVEAFVMRGQVKAFLFRQPLVILTYLFLALSMQLNIFAINYARSLLKAWKAKGFKTD
ncbi:protein jagunal homolog 1-B-like [Styela clava]